MHDVLDERVCSAANVEIRQSSGFKEYKAERSTVCKRNKSTRRCEFYLFIHVADQFCVCIDFDLQIGYVTHQKVKQLMDAGSITETTRRKFYTAVRLFFKRAVEYSLEHLPLDDELLKNASFANFEKRLESSPIQAEYFVTRYECYCALQNILNTGNV